jgi:diketogulonate reductase-like aldo/keto reductase
MQAKTINNFTLNPIGIGTWTIGGAFYEGTRVAYADYSQDEEAITAIKYSLDKGQNHIDTAQIYGAEHCEEIVGEAIKGFDRAKIFIASKVWQSHLKRNAVPKSAEAMLKRLGTTYLDMLYVHNSWDIEPMEEYIAGLNDALG